MAGSSGGWGDGGSRTPRNPRVPTTPPVDPTAWAKTQPTSINQLLAQLSANIGQDHMPGGKSGDVRMGSFGSGVQPQMNVDAKTYGETGGETMFFDQSQLGGMTPVSAVAPIPGWDPLGLQKPVTTTKKSKTSTPAPSSALSQAQLMALINQIFGTA